ncbi:hypothetical protein [Dokdonella soli]|uniref:hypothetical protein n=1 Tax=Dokdonella soli TaxID=529810 RepID=UPI0031DBBCE3
MFASAEERERRLAICQACPHRTEMAVTHAAICGRCGCVLAMKASLQRASCPINQW